MCGERSLSGSLDEQKTLSHGNEDAVAPDRLEAHGVFSFWCVQPRLPLTRAGKGRRFLVRSEETQRKSPPHPNAMSTNTTTTTSPSPKPPARQFITREFADALAGRTAPPPYLRVHDPAQRQLAQFAASPEGQEPAWARLP